MNIGFYFECSKKSGGVYQYALNLLDALKEMKEHKYTVFNISNDFPFDDFRLPNWEIVNIVPIQEATAGTVGVSNQQKSSLKRRFNLFVLELLRKFKLYNVQIFLERLNSKKRASNFLGHNLDLMFFHGPSELSFLTDIPAVLPIHDLQHRAQPEFLEVSSMGQYEKREYLYNNIKKSAYKILVDSLVGKEDVIKYYDISSDRIEVVQFLPPNYLKQNVSAQEKEKVLKKYGLPSRFLFYPAQFWPHKNHKNLVLAIKTLREGGLTVPLVLVGTRQELWGEFDNIKKLIKEEELEGQIYFLNYVSNDEMSVLYKLATALVMPTFFGPTNIPVVEAWFMDCPVLYSDIRGCREQAGDAALLFDPKNPESIAEKIQLIWGSEAVREDLISKGRRHLSSWTRQNFNDKIIELINNFKRDEK